MYFMLFKQLMEVDEAVQKSGTSDKKHKPVCLPCKFYLLYFVSYNSSINIITKICTDH